MPYFLNADLDVYSASDLTVISKAFGDEVFELHCGEDHNGGYFARFEIDTDESSSDALVLIKRFCDSIDSFSAVEKAVWNAADSRVIDLGYQSDEGDLAIHCRIPLDLSQRLCNLKIELHMTFYPLEGKLS